MRRLRAILISGAPATGKSTLAAALAPRLGAALLDIDVATGPLTTVVSDLIGVADLSDPRIAPLTRAPRYETLYALAADNLRAGISVVLVAPFTTERSAAGWTAAAERLATHAVRADPDGLRHVAAEPVMVWLHLPPDQLVERLRRRAATRDTDKLRDPDAFLATVDRDPPAAPHLAVDASTPLADQVECVVAHLA
jgi:predicted kinase